MTILILAGGALLGALLQYFCTRPDLDYYVVEWDSRDWVKDRPWHRKSVELKARGFDKAYVEAIPGSYSLCPNPGYRNVSVRRLRR